MPHPLLCMKTFDKRIFLKHQTVFQWNISVQWDNNFSTKNRDTPSVVRVWADQVGGGGGVEDPNVLR